MDGPLVLARAIDGDAAVTWALALGEDLGCVEGHFPGNAVVPGVAQLHWAIELARQEWPALERFRGVQNLKFRRPVRPPATLTVRLRLEDGHRLRFECVADGTPCASGRVDFA
jgi:3-hydroxymyristoyl/3-hydroxydecanoyl-(acyl carrier protein) dehydratase